MKRLTKCGLLWAAVLLLLFQTAGFVGCTKQEQFAPAEYAVTVSAVGEGSLSASAETVAEGEPVTFTAKANRGYVLERLEINGGRVHAVRDTYTIVNVLRDIKAKAYFVKPEVAIEGYDGSAQVLSAVGRVGGVIGQLPTPSIVGKRVLYWTYENGSRMYPTDPIEQAGVVKLYAVTEEIPAEEKARLVPYSVTTSYFDAAATKYGVVFHTENMPIAPVALVLEKPLSGEPDWSSAQVIAADAEEWLREYVSHTVIDGLKFGTDYLVKVGDYAADKYSRVYEFTTRESVVTDTKFFFVSDSQQSGLSEHLGELNGYSSKHGKNIGAGKTYYSETLRSAVDRFPDAQFILHGGDYVENGTNTAYWRDMLGSVDAYLFDLPTQALSGNHEGAAYGMGDGSVWYEMTSKVFNIDGVRDAITAAGHGIYYSFDYGPAHIVCLRSEDTVHNWQPDSPIFGQFGNEQINWLKNDLGAVDRNVTPWVIVVAHQAVITAEYYNSSHVTADRTYSQIMPILTDYDVDLFLSGHNHTLEISNPLVWDKTYGGSTMEYNGGASFVWKNVKPSDYTAGTAIVDGNSVKTFNYADGFTGKRGTVYHQVACAGPQYLSLRDPYHDLSFTRDDLTANIEKTDGLWNCLLTTGSIDKTDPQDNSKTKYQTLTGAYYAGDVYKGYSMYDYIEIDSTSLTCRSYGVDVYGQVYGNGQLQDYSVYVDGFRLNK